MYLNKTQIIGNLTRDPELKTLPSGVKVANFSIATNYSYKNKDGEKMEEVEFHNVVAFGKQAEVIAQYCKKGSQLYVEGRLKTQSWEDAGSGKKMYRTETILESFQFGKKSEIQDSTEPVQEDTLEDLSLDDIPF